MKKLKLFLIAILMVFALSISATTYATSPDGTITKSNAYDTGLNYGDGTITAYYDSKIFQGSTYLPIYFSLSFSDVRYLDSIEFTRWLNGEQVTEWVTVSSFNNGGVLYDGFTSETLLLEVDDDLTGANSVTITGYKYKYWSSFFSAEMSRTVTDLNETLSFEVVSTDTQAPVITGGGVWYSDYDNPDTIATIQASLSASDETDGNITANIVNIIDNYTGNEAVLGDHLTRWQVSDAAGNTTTTDVTVRVVDITDPVVTLTGSSTIYVEYGTTYTEPGATWTDNYDGSGTVTDITGTVNNSVLGTYTLTYTYTDTTGWEDSVTRTVIVRDTTNPIITLTGDATIYIEYGQSYTEPGATYTDAHAGTGAATVTGTVNDNVLGTYTVTYTKTDASGNTGTITRTVIVQDTTKPTIGLIGGMTVYVEYGDSYVEPGATWTDAYDGTGPVTNITGTVDDSTLGTYILTYTYTDTSGNTRSVDRTVIVEDSTKPIITLNGASTIYVEFGSSYTEPGATWTDNYDTGGSVSNIVGTVDVNTLGSYTITYHVWDSEGNQAVPVTRTVVVEDTTAPTITLGKWSPFYVEYGESYVEWGATWTDAVDGSGTVTLISGSVDDATLGTYTITYTYTDSSGNTGTATRTVTVRDTIAPQLTLNGASTIYIEFGDTYTESGVSYYDAHAGVGTEVQITGTVLNNTLGTYTLTYSYTDISGNTGTVTRTVIVRDTTDPVVTLNGEATVYVEYANAYTEQGATWTDNYSGSGTVSSITGTVNINALGSYTITYTFNDPSGNSGSITRTVIVQDTTKPVINLTGGSTVYVEYNNAYNEQGATWSDNYDAGGAVTTITGTVNISVLGSYTITYEVTDSNGNTATAATRTVIVQDTTKPVISLTGDGTVYIEFGDNYTEDGATWTDNYDGLGSVASISGTVNVGVLGSYTVTYTFTDSNGNVANQVERTVIVQDTLAPEVIGELTTIVTWNSQAATLAELVANMAIYDRYDGDVTGGYTVTLDEYTGNEGTTGTYNITISISDSNGNAMTHSFTIEVRDDQAPTITIDDYIIDTETADTMTLEEIRQHILNR